MPSHHTAGPPGRHLRDHQPRKGPAGGGSPAKTAPATIQRGRVRRARRPTSGATTPAGKAPPTRRCPRPRAASCAPSSTNWPPVPRILDVHPDPTEARTGRTRADRGCVFADGKPVTHGRTRRGTTSPASAPRRLRAKGLVVDLPNSRPLSRPRWLAPGGADRRPVPGRPGPGHRQGRAARHQRGPRALNQLAPSSPARYVTGWSDAGLPRPSGHVRSMLAHEIAVDFGADRGRRVGRSPTS
jgi:hypothetical protein